MLGAKGDASTDDTTAITSAIAVALAIDVPVVFNGEKTYKFSQLTFSNTVNIITNGAVLASDGSLTSVVNPVTITLGNDIVFDQLVITTPGTETNTNILSLGDRVRGGLIDIAATSQRAGGGITTAANSVHIEYVRTNKIDRPLHLAATDGASPGLNNYIGFLEATSYVRGFRADNCEVTLGGYKMQTMSANASYTNGHNGILLQGVQNSKFGDGFIADSGEHGVRVGGSSSAAYPTKYVQFGQIYTKNTGGCALKLNPTLEISAGVNERCSFIQVAGVIGVDVGNNTLGGNRELLRITRSTDVYIGYAVALVDDATASCQYAAQINASENIYIGTLGGDSIQSGFVLFDATSDVSGTSYAGDVSNIRIERIIGTCSGSNGIGVSMGSNNISDVDIGVKGAGGWTTNLFRWNNGTLTGKFYISGSCITLPTIQDAPASDNFIVDISYAYTKVVGA
jgi:hypothetical protein